jgi:hypothetical protein
MKWIAELSGTKQLTLTIKHDRYAGYYLYVYIDGKDTYDYLQDTLEIAMEQAQEQFGVPLDAWEKVEE